MNDEIEKLKRDYRGIEAPAHLSTRIAGELGSHARQRSRLPAVATAIVAAAAITLMPLLLDNDAAVPVKPSLSLATVTRLLPKKPPLASPSLSRLRSVKTPPLPAKPDLKPADKPRSLLDINHDSLEEPLHAHT